jgi:hypothetical protein
VTSPSLFNFYIAGVPTPPDGILLVAYADDTTVAATGPVVEELVTKLNDYLPRLTDFLAARDLEISAEKSTATVFSTWNREPVAPDVLVNGLPVPFVKNPKILGVIHDSMMNWDQHAKYAVERTKSRNNVLKAMAGTTWGAQKETLLATYKAIGRSVAEYAVPIWGPNASETHWKRLNAAQNDALRIATGCHRMTAVEHLHRECKILPLKTHSEMVAQQYLAGCHELGHPCNNIATEPPPQRVVRETVGTKFRERVRRYLPRVFINKAEKHNAVKQIHTDIVAQTIAGYGPNRVLGAAPPEVDNREEQLERPARCALAQLRSGFCRHLNSYKARIDPTVADVCPRCGASPHDVPHIFNCPSTPTQLQPNDLWAHPVEAAAFLSL